MSLGSHASNLTYKDVITCTNVVISLLILSYTHKYWFVSLHWVRYNCVDVDEYESLSSAIIPVLPLLHQSTTWPLRAIIAVYKVHVHASISIDSLCNYWTPARLQGPVGIALASVDLWNKISQFNTVLGRNYTFLAFVHLSTEWLALAIGDSWKGHCSSVERDCF